MKKKLILGSALGIIMCSSLIAGATMALFTSESKVNIAVTSGKVDVSAEAKEVTTYTNGKATTENGTFDNEGTAVIDDSGKLVLSGITPGDKAVVKLEITNGSSVAYKQRISLSSTLDAELMDQLIVGVSEDNQSYTYYSDYVTAWEKGEPVEEPVTTTIYLSIELPAYVGDDWQGKEGEIALAVEAVQGNADVSDTAVANEVYLVNDKTGLADAIQLMESGDTVVLYSSDWKNTNAEIDYDGDKEITVRGYGLDNVNINAAEGTVNLYNDANSLTVTAIADNSLHIYGNIGSAEVADGRAVVEPGAYVKDVNVVPSESNSVKFEVEKEATVTNIKVNTSNSAASADVVIAEGVKVEDMTVEGSGDVTLDNSGTISNTTVSEDSNFENVGTGESSVNATVTTAENLKKALAINGATVTLGDNILVDAVVPEGVSVILDLNGHKITNVSDHTIINNGVLEIKDSLGGGVVDNITHAKAAVVNNSGAMFTLNGGTLTRSAAAGTSESANGNSYYVFVNNGDAYLNDGTIKVENDEYSSMIINVAAEVSDLSQLRRANMEITGGNYEGGLNTIKNDAYCDLTITGGTFKNSVQTVIYNYDVADITGGTFIADGKATSFFNNSKYSTTDDSSSGLLSVRDIVTEGNVAIFAPGSTKGGNGGTITVYDATLLQAAIDMSITKTVRFGQDIEVHSSSTPGITISWVPNVNTTIEFNGHKLRDTGTGAALYIDESSAVLQDSVGNGGIEGGSGGDNRAIEINGYSGANLMIYSGTYTVGADAKGEGNSCIYISKGNGASVIIEGGTFSSAAPYAGKYYVLNLKQTDNAVTNTTQFKVRGGTFIGQDPSKGDDNLGGNFLGNYLNYVYASVYTGKTNGIDTWTVVEQQTVNSAEELTAAIENGGVQAIKLGADITVDKTLVVSANDSFDIDLGGHMLKLVETDRMNMLLKVYGKLTVKNGSVYGNGSWGVIYSAGSSILNIDADIESVQSSDNYATLITVADNSVVNILGGSYQNTVTEDDGSGHYDLIYATHNGCVNIYGGTFKNYTPKWTLNCRDADDNSSVNVFGGKYYNFDPSKAGIKGEDTFVGENEVCVAEGYTVTRDGEWYAVVKA